MAGSLRVLEDEDAVVAVRAVGLPVGVAVRLGYPEPAAVVDRHGDRLGHVRLAGEERGVEAVRQRHLGGGLAGRRGGVGQGQVGVGGRSEKKADGEGVHAKSGGRGADEGNCSGGNERLLKGESAFFPWTGVPYRGSTLRTMRSMP